MAPRPAVPIAKPAAAQMNSTLGFSTTSVAAVTAARPGVTLVSERIHPGVWADRVPCGPAEYPGTRSTPPTPMRSQAAHVGALSRPPRRSATSTNTEVSANSPTSQPARKASQSAWVRVQHQDGRNDGQRRQRDYQRQRNELDQHRSPIARHGPPFRRMMRHERSKRGGSRAAIRSDSRASDAAARRPCTRVR